MCCDGPGTGPRYCGHEQITLSPTLNPTCISPRAFVIRQRINRALYLLAATDQTIAMISEDVGHDSLHSFTRTFTEYVGLPPGQYRKRLGRPGKI